MITYKNPICVGADPFILLDNGKYYHYATLSDDGYPVSVSDDLVHWEQKGFCLRKEDVAGDKWFWAPEILKHNGKYYMAYSADRHLGIAVADSPLGPFRQHSVGFLFDEEVIDGDFLEDDDGNVYLYYVRCDDGNKIYGAKMTADLTATLPETEHILVVADCPWELHTPPCKTVEGPFVLKHNGRYYLTYSANDYQDPCYGIGLAVAESPLGPYTKYGRNPILSKSERIQGTGHHSFTTSKDGQKLLCVYHRHKSTEAVHPRMTCIDEARFVYDSDLGFDVLTILGPTDEETTL